MRHIRSVDRVVVIDVCRDQWAFTSSDHQLDGLVRCERAVDTDNTSGE